MPSKVLAPGLLALLVSTAALAQSASEGMPPPSTLNWPPKPPTMAMDQPVVQSQPQAETAANATQPDAAARMPVPSSLNWPPKAPAVANEAQTAPAASVVATPANVQDKIAVPPPALPQPSPPGVKADEPKAAAVAAPEVFNLATELGDNLREAARGTDQADRKALLSYYEARKHVPVWVTEHGFTPAAKALVAEIAKADDYGLEVSAFKLPNDLGRTPSRSDLAHAEMTLSVAALKYARHARGGRADPAQLSKNLDRKPQLLEPVQVMEMLAAAKAPDKTLRDLHPKHPQFEMLRQAYLALKAGKDVDIANAPAAVATPPPKDDGKRKAAAPPAGPKLTVKKLLANMEQWRWMPDMGEYHIWSNIPEFQFRIVRNNSVVHAERIIAGKPDTQTPIFSDEMEMVVFQPYWNVPESIKWKELQPQLSRSPGALQRQGLRAQRNGRDVDPGAVEWFDADMTQFHIFQPPGPGNALGQVKFLFPNKHDVYMHDTPMKHLFNNTGSRAFSHGCMRVRDPMKFAELLLANDKGWDGARVRQLANSGPENNEIKLGRKVPVHVTYFTVIAEADGKVRVFGDIYGHESRINMGLEGKAHLIAQPREEKVADWRKEAQERARRSPYRSTNQFDLFKSIFNF